MTAPTIGHNRPPSIFDEITPDVPKMHFFKCDIVALRKAIFDKPLDIRGAFISALLAVYEHMEPLPADDNIARMRCGIMDMRVYRRVKREMVAYGLMQEDSSGRLTNERCEIEITTYVKEFRQRQKSAKDREEKAAKERVEKEKKQGSVNQVSRQLGDSYGLAKPELGASYAIANAELKGDLSKKPNEINEANSTRKPQDDHEAPLRARVLELELDSREEKKDRKTPPPPEQEAAQGRGGGDAFSALNGTGDEMARFIAKYAFVTEPEARRMLTTNCQVFGASVMMEAYATVLAKMSAEVVGKPYPLMIAIARKLKETAPAKQSSAAKAASLLRRY